MATYVNNLRLKEITTGDEDGTWGTSTNLNLELIGEGFGYGTEQVAADSNETFTMADGAADGVRGMYLKFTSAGALTATRTLTLAPNTVSKVWIIENATSGSQIITIKQGAGATVNVANGDRAFLYTDGAGSGAAVFTANPSEAGGTVTSVGTTGTVNGITLTGTVTTSGNLTLGGTLANVSLTSQVTGTLPVANGGTGITSLGANVATWWGTPSSTNLKAAVTGETGSGALVFGTSPTFVTPVLGTPASGTATNLTGLPPAGVTGTAAILGANTFTALQTLSTGANIASATAVDLTAATGNAVVITGTTPSTSLTMTAGQQMVLLPSAAWPLTYHATTMNINGGVSYTCAAGDRVYAVKDLANVIRVSVFKQDGTSVVAGVASSVAVGNITGAGTGVLTALAVNVGSAGAPVVLGGALGTPSGGTATNLTGLPPAGVTGTAAILGANTFTALQTQAAGADIASATATDLTAATGNVVVITGTTTATSLTMTAGQQMILIAAAAWPLTFHATTMNIIGGVDYTCAAGDRLYVTKDVDNVIRVSVLKQDGTSVVAASGGVSYDQEIKSADYTLVIGDAGKQIYHPAADTTSRTWTIPANASVAFDIGTVILFVNEVGAGLITLSITSDTLADLSGSTGTQILSAGSVVNALKVTATRWLAWSENRTASSAGQVAVSHTTSPYVTAYSFDSVNGFGSKFANPTTLPSASTAYSVEFSPSGGEIVVGTETAAYVFGYPFTSGGFGTKYSNPGSSLPGTVYDMVFSPDGDQIWIAHVNSPFVSGYDWTNASGFGSKYSNPGSLPAGSGKGVDVNSDASYLCMAHDASPYAAIYAISGSGFGSKSANPSVLPAGAGQSAGFSLAGTEVVIGGAAPYAEAWAVSGGTWGAQLADPSPIPYVGVVGQVFSNDGAYIFCAHSWSPYISCYAWSASGFGTKVTNPGTLAAGAGFGVCMSTSGNEVFLSHSASPYVTAWKWTGTAFGTKYADPTTTPTGVGQQVSYTTAG